MASDEPESAHTVETAHACHGAIDCTVGDLEGVRSRSKKSEPTVIRGDQAVAKALRKKRTRSPADSFSDELATAIEMLMAHGHRLADVWGYTMRAVQVYRGFDCDSSAASNFMTLTVAVRHTQGTDDKVFREFLNGLQGDD